MAFSHILEAYRVLIDAKTLSIDFAHKVGPLPTVFNNFRFLTPPTGGVTGVICGADLTEKWHFWAFLANKSIQTCVNLCYNTIDRLCALDRIPADPF